MGVITRDQVQDVASTVIRDWQAPPAAQPGSADTRETTSEPLLWDHVEDAHYHARMDGGFWFMGKGKRDSRVTEWRFYCKGTKRTRQDNGTYREEKCPVVRTVTKTRAGKYTYTESGEHSEHQVTRPKRMRLPPEAKRSIQHALAEQVRTKQGRPTPSSLIRKCIVEQGLKCTPAALKTYARNQRLRGPSFAANLVPLRCLVQGNMDPPRDDSLGGYFVTTPADVRPGCLCYRPCLRVVDFMRNTGDTRRQEGDLRRVETHPDTLMAINRGEQLGEPIFNGTEDASAEKILVTLAPPERDVLEDSADDAGTESGSESQVSRYDEIIVSDEDDVTSDSGPEGSADSGAEGNAEEESDDTDQSGDEDKAAVQELPQSESEPEVVKERKRNLMRNDSMLAELGIADRKDDLRKAATGKRAKKNPARAKAKAAAAAEGVPEAAAPATPPEVRVDCRDRGLWRKYTKAEFSSMYGGEQEWNEAPRQSDLRTSADKKCTGNVDSFVQRYGPAWPSQWFMATKANPAQEVTGAQGSPGGEPRSPGGEAMHGLLTPRSGRRSMRDMLETGEMVLQPRKAAETDSRPQTHTAAAQTSPPAGSKGGTPQAVAASQASTAVTQQQGASKENRRAPAKAPPVGQVEDIEPLVFEFVQRRFPDDCRVLCTALAKAGWLRFSEMDNLKLTNALRRFFRAEGVLDGQSTEVVQKLRRLSVTRCGWKPCGKQMAVAQDETGLVFHCSSSCSERAKEQMRQRPPVPAKRQRWR